MSGKRKAASRKGPHSPAAPAEFRRWRAGMRLMNEIAASEARALTEQDKSRQIEALFDSAFGMRWPDRNAERAEVARRWNRLREVLGAGR